MSEQAAFTLRGRNPDVLTCIANLSNDEVFTPPEFANRMLDTLTEAWAASNRGANRRADETVRMGRCDGMRSGDQMPDRRSVGSETRFTGQHQPCKRPWPAEVSGCGSR